MIFANNFTNVFQNAVDNFKNTDCSFYTLLDFDYLLKFAVDNKLFVEKEFEFIMDWELES